MSAPWVIRFDDGQHIKRVNICVAGAIIYNCNQDKLKLQVETLTCVGQAVTVGSSRRSSVSGFHF